MDLSLDFPSQLWAPFALSRPPIRCSAGYLIYLQNTEATCFYYLKSGRVKSYIQSADGAERVLNIYPAGSLFGEASFFDELPRVSSAVALSPCELVPIDRELAAQAVSRDPELALSMMKYLARTVRLLSEQLDAMAFRPAEWRIARYLPLPLRRAGPVYPGGHCRRGVRQPGHRQPDPEPVGAQRYGGAAIPEHPAPGPRCPGAAVPGLRSTYLLHRFYLLFGAGQVTMNHSGSHRSN